MGEIVKLCNYCENRNGPSCSLCSNNKQKEGRELCISQMIESKGYKKYAKLRNIVRASEIVLFKDLCRIMGVDPKTANAITTQEVGAEALKNHLPADEFLKVIGTFLDQNKIQALIDSKVIENLDYVYSCSGMVYGSSIHASGTLFSEGNIDLPIDKETGDVHCDGHYAEELGYIKYDLLSLSTLVPILEILGIKIDWNEDINNKELMEYFQGNDLTFAFQFGGSVVSNMLDGINKDAINVVSLAEISAINRPGPLNIGLNTKWVDSKNGKEQYSEEANAILELLKKSGQLKI